jgi:hypothetical protein
MSMAFEIESAPQRARWTQRPGQRLAHRDRPGRPRLEAARHFDFGAPVQALSTPRQLLIRSISHLERSDWTILFTVAMAIAAIGVLGVLSLRLASLAPTGVVTTATGAAVPAATASPLAALAPGAPPPSVAPAQPTPIPAPPAFSTVDAGSPGAGARLRAEPRLEASIVERIVHGTQVTEVGPEASDGARTWRQIKSPSGNVGWMDASLLRRAAGR